MFNVSETGLDISALSAQPAAAKDNDKELGQTDFLALLVAQLQNQDPFQPMENGEFLGQMAQFSTVEGIGDMSKALQQLADSMYSTQALQASSMIGKSVLTEGNLARLPDGGAVQGAVDLPFTTGSAVVRVSNAAGQPVREIPLGPQSAGLLNFQWDGITAKGTQAPPGDYRLTAVSQDNGQETAVPTLLATRVASVSLSAGGTDTRITTEFGQELALTQVRAIL